MNVATVLQVPRSSLSPPGVAAPASLTAARDSGAFSSLLAGLVSNGETSFLAGLIAEEPVAPSTSANPVPGRAKGKDTKSGENKSSTGKKDEPKAKSGLVQATQQPAIVKPPILLSSVNEDSYSQTSETSPIESPVDAAPDGQATSSGFSAALAPPSPAPKPEEDAVAPSARIAFGLRLTTSQPEASTGIRWSAQEVQTGRALDTKPNISGPESAEANRQSPKISSVPLTGETNSGAASSHLVGNNSELPVAVLSLPSLLPEPSHVNVPDLTLAPGSGGDGIDNAARTLRSTETGLAGGRLPAIAANSPVANDPIQASPGDPANQQDSGRSLTARGGPPEGSDSGSQAAPDSAAAATAVSSLSRPSADAQGANLQAAANQIPSEEDKPQKPSSQNTSSKPADAHDATAVGTSVRVSPKQAEQKPVEELDDAGTAPTARRSPIEARRDLYESSHNGSGENAGTLEPQGRPAQAPAVTDARPGRSVGDPSGATSSQATQMRLSRAAASQATPSQATPAQTTLALATPAQATPAQTTPALATPAQATPGQATAPQATKISNEPEINAPPQPQPARQISLKLTGEDSSSVNVEFSEKAGKVQVAVRTSDPDLAKSLRTDLGDLVGRLESKGFKTEAWVPTALRHMPAVAPGQSSSSNSQGGERQAGSGTGQRQERPGQNGSNQRQQARWKAQLEETLSTEETRTNNE